jgi:L-alanine-DL-glutamate epimerase-like enolase superfamily enzyme
MRITDVKAVSVEISRGPTPFHDGGFIVPPNSTAPYGYVEVFTDEGLTGFCPAPAPPALVENSLKPMLVGENPLEIERIWSRLFQGWRHPKMDDLMAISKIDIAVWDLAGKAIGQPVWRLLGGARRHVKAYGAGGMYQAGKGIPELVAEMVDFVEHGFGAVKMKVGWEKVPMKEDVARVRAVREAIGPDVDLMVDVNHAWLPHQAIKFARMIEEYDPYWLEEPVDPWDYQGCAEVARAIDTPVATGENVGGRWAWRDMIDARGCDIVQADALYCGGFTEWRRIAAYAAAHNLPMAPHGQPHVGAQCVGGVPNGMIVEVGMYAGRKPSRPPMIAPLVVENSVVDLGETPGMGWQIDRDAIRWNLEHPT